MDSLPLNALLNNPMLGFAYHKVILDDLGKPVDYTFLEINSTFEKITGFKRAEVIKCNVRSLISDIEKDVFDWIELYGDIALNGGEKNFEQYSKSLNKWFSVYVYSTEKLYFSTMFLDITVRKLTEDNIRKKEDQFRKLSAQVPGVLFQFTKKLDGTYVVPIASDGIQEMFGCTPEDVIDTYNPIWRIIHPDDLERVKNEYASSEETMSTLITKFRILLPGKNVKWIYSKSVPECLPDGSTTWYGFNDDITDRQLVEDKLRRISQVVEQNPVSVIVTNLVGDIEYVNPKFTQLTGYTQEEVLGENPKIVQSGEHSIEMYKELWETIAAGNIWQGEFHNKKKNGDLFWEWATISPIFNDQGDITNYLAIKEDITDRKKAERDLNMFSQVVKQSPNMILIVGLNAVIEYANPSYESITGYKSDEIVGTTFYILQEGEDDQEYETLKETLKSGEAWHGEIIDKKKNGAYYWQSISVNPILSEAGEVIHYVAIMQDISDRKRVENEIYELNSNLEQKINDRTSELTITNEILMNEIIARKKNEEELKKSRHEAEEANRAKSDFLSRMSHELRTPMNSILGFAQLFEMGDLTVNQRKGVGHILKSGRHLLKLINEVLDISKIESGKVTLSIELIKVKEVINEAIDLVHPLTKETDISIEYIAHPSDELFVKADKQRLVQVLVNLLGNAIKYNRNGGSVTVSAALLLSDEMDAQNLRISIQDTGIGITDENIKKLFTPFVRIGDEMLNIEGTGLGLSIAKELMTVMSGRIGVKSVIGHGSTFWVELPCSSENSMHNIEGLSNMDDLDDNSLQIKGTVLYIEDNRSNTEFLEQIIMTHRPGIKLICNMFGKNTVKLALEEDPDVILLDLDLPDIHGSEVMKNLQANSKTRHIPVIVISADVMPEQIRRLYKAGVKKYLTKPLDVIEFLNDIDIELLKK